MRDRPQVSSEWSRSISSLLQITKIFYIRSFVLIRGEFGKTFAQPVHSKRHFNHLRLGWFVKEVMEHFVELSGSSGTRMFCFVSSCSQNPSYLWFDVKMKAVIFDRETDQIWYERCSYYDIMVRTTRSHYDIKVWSENSCCLTLSFPPSPPCFSITLLKNTICHSCSLNTRLHDLNI